MEIRGVSYPMISFMRRGISVSTWGADMITPSTRVRYHRILYLLAS